MVVGLGRGVAVDRVFAALADGTRRDIVTRVLADEASVTALAAHYEMSFAAVQRHVAVLERAELVTKRRRGREQLVGGRPDTIRAARRLLDAFEDVWRGRLDRIDDLLAEDDSAPVGQPADPARTSPRTSPPRTSPPRTSPRTSPPRTEPGRGAHP